MAKTIVKAPKLKAPRQCVQSFNFHGCLVKPGDLYGVDKIGPYVTRPIMYHGYMAFKRPQKYGDTVMWIERRASKKTSETVRYILQHIKVTPPPCTTKAWKEATKQVAAERAEKTHAAWRGEQASVIQKRGMKFKARQHGNCAEYRNATRAVYGDDVEINGRQVPVTDKIGFYLDGGTIR